MKDPSSRDVAVFTAATHLPADQLDAYLEQACGTDVELRRRVETLLMAHRSVGDFLEQSPNRAAKEATKRITIGERPGDHIGRYKLLQPIGEGGCGVVFMAEQEVPVRRRVALKIVKPGMDTRSVIARFEAERQALALMDHPNIAKVLDAGATESGRPYFVMELIRGVKITEYCDQHSLPTGERLELFAQVCQAIQHAHQKGIIHRDIKPSNILVTASLQGVPLPMVIDFGIAKATTNQRLTDKTLFTAFEMLVGTPAYMSPEQAALSSVDVDTRTDIYSLGVLLYELLTGSTPFQGGELLQAGLDEIRRVIRDQDPVRPSTRLSRMTGADLKTVARQRQSEPPRLIRAVRGDLDWIVLKALEKDRTRRYETANSLALDIQRYLANEPIFARPPGRLYKLQKAVSRHKLLFVGSGIIALLLVSSLVVVSMSLAKERHSRLAAETAAAESQQVKQFLESMLQSAGPSVALGQDTTLLRGILDETARRVGNELTNQPAVEAELRGLIGRVWLELADYDQAEKMQRDALRINRRVFGDQSARAAASLNDLGVTLWREGKQADAEAVDIEALTIGRKLAGNPHPLVAASLNNLADVYRHYGRPAEAEPLNREALAIRKKLFGSDSLEAADSLRVLSILMGDEGKWPEAETLARQVCDIRRQRLGSEHPLVAASLGDIAWAAGHQDKWDEVESLQREKVTMQRRLFGTGHPLYLVSLGNLCSTLEREGKLVEAQKFLDEALTPAFMKQPASANLLILRAELFGRQQRWQPAAADAALVVDYQPNLADRYHTLAPLLAITGNRAAYEQLCKRILANFGGTTNAYMADRMAEDCLVLPQRDLDLQQVGRLAEVAVEAIEGDASMPFFETCKALSEYRLGNFAAAVDWAQKPLTSSQDYARAQASAVLAMAHWKLGREAEASAALAQGEALVLKLVPAKTPTDLGDGWLGWLFARISLNEATALIHPGSTGVRPTETWVRSQ